jgi:TolA-binding protein
MEVMMSLVCLALRLTLILAIPGTLGLLPASGQNQLTPDDAAFMLLNSARRAYNEKNYTFARDRFREFLQKHGNHKEVPSARFGLALALLDGPEKDYNAALEPLQQIVGVQDFPDRPLALYYLGYAHRGLGNLALAQAGAKPQEAPQHRNTANQRFEQAAQQFAAAVPLLETKAKTPGTNAPASPELEWAARARCDQAEMLLRVNKAKEALAVVTPLIADATLAKSKYRGQGVYLHGYAGFMLQDYHAAGRSLSQLAPFNDPVFGGHARYLLARVHHLAEERPEAALHYEAVLTHFDQQKKAAPQLLQNASAMKENPDEKLRLEALLRNPPPEHVSRAAFYWAILLFEDGKYGEAQPRFATFAQQYPGSPLIPEAQLRLGFCHVQLKQFPEAIRVLQPLEQQQPGYADQVLWWVAKAQHQAADPNNAAAYGQALKTAMETLRRAADRANQLAASDAEAKTRRGDMLLELGDMQQLAKQFKEAAATYQQVQQENLVPDRNAETLQRQATALHLAGMFAESDALCQRFFQAYPKNPLGQAVLFRYAENAYFAAVAASKSGPPAAGFGEAIKRYQQLIEKHPEFSQIGFAKFGLGQCLYRLGEYEKAAEAFAAINSADRTGELANAPYLQADCLIRILPADANDALAAGRMQGQLGDAIKLLDSYLGGAGNGPQVPDALLKLGHCHQQMGNLLAEPKEKQQAFATARQVYERIMQQFGNHPTMPVAVFERAKCMGAMGDINGTMNELNRFQSDPLKQHPIAPIALVRLSAYLRAANRAPDAVKLLEQCRTTHEPNLVKDPNRVEVAVLVRYHHGLALKDSGKLPEARGVFESIVKDFANRPEVPEAAWRAGQCRKDEAAVKIETALKFVRNPGVKPAELIAAETALQDGLKQLRETSQFFEDQANQIKQKAAGSENHLRMIYEAAWCQRRLGQQEIDQTRQRLQAEALKKLQDDRTKQAANMPPMPPVRAPEVPLTAIPLQPAEQKSRDLYKSMIAAAGDAPLSLDARLELAEMHTQRNELDAAIPLLTQALEKDASPEMTDRLRLRLGACQLAKGNAKAAFSQFDAIAQNPKSPVAAEARYRAGECLIQQAGESKENFTKAIQYLTPFRDQGPLQNIANVSDRALLRLAHAFAGVAQWDQSRQACDILLQRFPQSPWVHEARYGIGWAFQNQKQYDAAANAYNQVTQSTAVETAARAQLQIGLCRLEQKRHAEAANALLVVPFTYDYPELSALALCEASRAFTELKQTDQAAKLLQKVVKDHPTSRWAEVAKQRLAEIQGNGKKG